MHNRRLHSVSVTQVCKPHDAMHIAQLTLTHEIPIYGQIMQIFQILNESKALFIPPTDVS